MESYQVNGRKIDLNPRQLYLLPIRNKESKKIEIISSVDIGALLRNMSEGFVLEGVREVIDDCAKYLSMDKEERNSISIIGVGDVPINECEGVPGCEDIESILKSEGVKMSNYGIDGVKRTKEIFEKIIN